MQIGFAPQFNFYRVNPISKNMQRGSSATGKTEKTNRSDSVSLSPQGKAMSLLDSLIKQKEQVKEQKNKLVASTIEKGDSMSSIKSQLETYEEQLKGLDDQIKAMAASQLEKQVDKKEVEDNAPKTKEEIKSEKLSDIVEISSGVSLAKSLSSIKNKIEGEANVLKSEIKLDGANGGAVLKSKTDRLFEIEGRMKSLDSQLFGKLNAVITSHEDNISQEDAVTKEDNEQEDLNKNTTESQYGLKFFDNDRRLNNKQFVM